MRRAALYVCYYTVTEPLVQTQAIGYLRELVRRDFEIHLLTFERSSLDRDGRDGIRRKLGRWGIRWHALSHPTRPSIVAGLYDACMGSLAALKLCVTHDIGLIHGRSHVGAAMGLAAQRLRGTKLLFDMRGLLADEYADTGHWKTTSVGYKVTKAIERTLFRRADAFVMLTKTIKADLLTSERSLRERVRDIEVVPCCADTREFVPDSAGRHAERRRRGWSDRRVLVYLGKLGTWYLVDEMAQFVAVALREDRRMFFQVVTQSDPSLMTAALMKAGVGPNSFDVCSLTPQEVPNVLMAADAGISFIRPCYSKRSSSPTKVGEYLAAGLPVVSTSGIGDCDEILSLPNLGVRIERLDQVAYRRAILALGDILDDPATPKRCREFAQEQLSLERIGAPRYASIYERLMSQKTASASLTERA